MKTLLAISRPIVVTSDTDASLKWSVRIAGDARGTSVPWEGLSGRAYSVARDLARIPWQALEFLGIDPEAA
jgi:hypothetical protein